MHIKLNIIFLIINLLFLFSCGNEFDENNAFGLLEKQCSFGARVPGSIAHKECRSLIVEQLKKYCDSVYIQSFKQKVHYKDTAIMFYNIIGIINPDKEKYYLFGSHYDSRPFSDKKNLPTPGANDGASSTALLLELARIVKLRNIDARIDFVFFDGEDGGNEKNKDDWFIGSSYFAKHIKQKPDYAIIVDMIGDRELDIYREGFSDLYSYELNRSIFKIAKDMNKKTFINKVGYYIEDDHIPLIKEGINCIDIIDMNYKYWHTTEDTPDKCSAKSLKDVGDVLLRFLYAK